MRNFMDKKIALRGGPPVLYIVCKKRCLEIGKNKVQTALTVKLLHNYTEYCRIFD